MGDGHDLARMRRGGKGNQAGEIADCGLARPFSFTASRFDALRLPFRPTQGPECIEGLKALSLSKGASPGRLGGFARAIAEARVPLPNRSLPIP
jgi:hypothetical protein